MVGNVQKGATVSPRLAAFVAGLSILVVAAGGIVRVLEAGLGCPDWPLCHGQVVPPGSGPALIEFSHRVVAGVFAVSVGWLALSAWRAGAEVGGGVPALADPGRALSRLGAWAVGLVAVQVGLGGLNVLTELAPEVGAAHLAVAMALVSVLGAFVEMARPGASAASGGVAGRQEQARRYRWAVAVAVLGFVVVAVGGYMRARGASLVCTDWPLCRGRLLPEPAWPIVLHWTHRAAALTLGVALAAAAFRFGGRFWWALGLYALQVGVGALAVVWILPPVLRVVHLTLAAVLLAVLASEAARVARTPAPVARLRPTT